MKNLVLRIILASFVVLLALLTISVSHAQAQTFTVLYSFKGYPDSANPEAGLFRDNKGNLYGTTSSGGSFNWGSVFTLDTAGNEIVLYNFPGSASDGSIPVAAVVMDKAGNLYGTTEAGGDNADESGDGTVFKLDTLGNFTTLHQFGPPDGRYATSTLLIDKRGNLYGTTVQGGANELGTVFKVDMLGKETVLHSFSGADGSYPIRSHLIMDKEGNLYGTTWAGGSGGQGTVFKLDIAGRLTVLHSFTGLDGAMPFGGVVMDKKGNLYGTTTGGGSAGAGTVFKLDSAGTESVLHSFSGSPDDGTYPADGLVIDKQGSLYGTTLYGGSLNFGVVFKVDTLGNETILHSFADAPDGNYPLAGLVLDKRGNLYGTTENGGNYNYGTVFELVP